MHTCIIIHNIQTEDMNDHNADSNELNLFKLNLLTSSFSIFLLDYLQHLAVHVVNHLKDGEKLGKREERERATRERARE